MILILIEVLLGTQDVHLLTDISCVPSSTPPPTYSAAMKQQETALCYYY